MHERDAPGDDRTEHLCRGFGLRTAIGGDRRVEFIDEDGARVHVLDARKQFAQHAHARRHDAAGHAGMHAFGEHVGPQRADQVAAQRGRAPELIVVATLGVETDDQARRAEAGTQRIDVGRQVGAAAFFACFDQHDAAGVGNLLLAQRADRGNGRKERIPVVGATAAIELAVTDHGGPRFEAVGPPRELRLLVEVPVHQHAVVHVARDVDHQYRRAAVEPQHLDLGAGRRLRLGPAHHQLDGGFHVPMRFPVRVEERGLVRDADVVDQLRQDRVRPGRIDVAFGF